MKITVAHDKGGVGKTTLAWNMIFVLQQMGKSVKVVDLDAKHTIFHLNNIRKDEKRAGITIVTPKSVNELISLCESYQEDILLMDVGGYDNDLTRNAIKLADKILTPLNDSATEIIGFATFQSILRKIGTPHIHVVFNRVHPMRKNFDDIINDLSMYENKTFTKTVIRASNRAYQTPLKKGGSVVDTTAQHHIDAIKELCHELI
jgi:chromosome partitioning protein